MRWAGIRSVRKSTTRMRLVTKRTPPLVYTLYLSLLCTSLVTVWGRWLTPSARSCSVKYSFNRHTHSSLLLNHFIHIKTTVSYLIHECQRPLNYQQDQKYNVFSKLSIILKMSTFRSLYTSLKKKHFYKVTKIYCFKYFKINMYWTEATWLFILYLFRKIIQKCKEC